MTETLWIVAMAWSVVVIALFTAAEVGPEKYRTAARWGAVMLATGGVGVVLWLLERRSERRAQAPVVPPSHKAEHRATDAEIADIDEEIDAVDEEIASAGKGHWEGGSLGSDMARRLRDEQD